MLKFWKGLKKVVQKFRQKFAPVSEVLDPLVPVLTSLVCVSVCVCMCSVSLSCIGVTVIRRVAHGLSESSWIAHSEDAHLSVPPSAIPHPAWLFRWQTTRRVLEEPRPHTRGRPSPDPIYKPQH